MNISIGKIRLKIKKWLLASFSLGTFHGIGKKYLQAYFDEFCYRFNRRTRESQLFDRLATACATPGKYIMLS